MRNQIRKLIKEALLRESQDLTLKNGTVLRNFKTIFKGLTTYEASFINQIISIMESFNEYDMKLGKSKARNLTDKGVRVYLVFKDLNIANIFKNHILSSGLYNPGSIQSTQIAGPRTVKPGQIFYLKLYANSTAQQGAHVLTFVLNR